MRALIGLLFSGLLLAQSSVYPPTVSAVIVAKVDQTAKSANIGSTLLYAVPAGAGGMYRASCHVVLTQSATTSSTLPNCAIGWTDVDTGVVASAWVSTSGTGNSVGASNSTAYNIGSGLAIVNAKAGTAINYSTASYVSSGVTPMQFAIHVKLEYLGQ